MTEGSPYTREECIEALQKANKIVDGKLSRPQYENLDGYEENDWPSPSVMYNKFGGWNNIKEKSGIETFGSNGGQLDVDESYFNEINSTEKAYWLGLLWADGWISSNNTIGLGLIDKEHIEKFRNALGANQKIQEDDKFYRIQIGSRKLINDLINLGFSSTKTFDDSLPPLEKEDYQRAFVRGLFDGDGHFEEKRMRLTSSSEGRLKKLKEWIGYDSTVFERGDGVYTLQTSVKYKFNIFCWLYNTDGFETKPKLERKYKSWKENLL